MKHNPVKRALREGKPAVGTWLSLGSITASRFLARAGVPVTDPPAAGRA